MAKELTQEEQQLVADMLARARVAMEQIKDYGGVVLKTSLDDAKELALRNALAGHVAAPPATGA